MVSRPFLSLWGCAKASPLRLPPTLATHRAGGSNLEIFKFGMYIMFPIGWMYYFGTNLESRFSVPDFWPAPETTHRIPFEREEIKELSQRLRAERLERKRKRLEKARAEMREHGAEETPQVEERIEELEQKRHVAKSEGTFGMGSIEKWAKGR